MNLKINQAIKLYPELLLPYLVMLSCLFIPSEIIITRFRIDETSVQLPFGAFKTVLFGYESKILISLIGLTLLNQFFALFKASFAKFIVVFSVLIFLLFAGFQLCLNTRFVDLGIYFSLLSSGFILLFNLKQRFW